MMMALGAVQVHAQEESADVLCQLMRFAVAVEDEACRRTAFRCSPDKSS
jgi:hypothetical protein